MCAFPSHEVLSFLIIISHVREYTLSGNGEAVCSTATNARPPLERALLLNSPDSRGNSIRDSSGGGGGNSIRDSSGGGSRGTNNGSWMRRGGFSIRDFGSWAGVRRWAVSGSGFGSVVESSLVDWSSSGRPYFCYLMTFLCCVLFLWQCAVGDWELAPMSENPFVGPSALVLVQTGAQVSGCILPPTGQWWRLVSAMFLHAGWLHLIANMGALLLIGCPIERAWGSVRIGVVYFVSGISAAFSTALFVPSAVAGIKSHQTN